MAQTKPVLLFFVNDCGGAVFYNLGAAAPLYGGDGKLYR